MGWKYKPCFHSDGFALWIRDDFVAVSVSISGVPLFSLRDRIQQ